MKMHTMILSGALASAMALIPAQLVLAGSSASSTTFTAHEIPVPKQDYELRLLEDQVQILRDKLEMSKGKKMSAKDSAEWHKEYKGVQDALNKWNDSIDGIH
jgi:hypothetical protein